MAAAHGWCEGHQGCCPNPSRFIVKAETETDSVAVCGKHLAAAVDEQTDGAARAIVVPFEPRSRRG